MADSFAVSNDNGFTSTQEYFKARQDRFEFLAQLNETRDEILEIIDNLSDCDEQDQDERTSLIDSMLSYMPKYIKAVIGLFDRSKSNDMVYNYTSTEDRQKLTEICEAVGTTYTEDIAIVFKNRAAQLLGSVSENGFTTEHEVLIQKWGKELAAVRYEAMKHMRDIEFDLLQDYFPQVISETLEDAVADLITIYTQQKPESDFASGCEFKQLWTLVWKNLLDIFHLFANNHYQATSPDYCLEASFFRGDRVSRLCNTIKGMPAFCVPESIEELVTLYCYHIRYEYTQTHFSSGHLANVEVGRLSESKLSILDWEVPLDHRDPTRTEIVTILHEAALRLSSRGPRIWRQASNTSEGFRDVEKPDGSLAQALLDHPPADSSVVSLCEEEQDAAGSGRYSDDEHEFELPEFITGSDDEDDLATTEYNAEMPDEVDFVYDNDDSVSINGEVMPYEVRDDEVDRLLARQLQANAKQALEDTNQVDNEGSSSSASAAGSKNMDFSPSLDNIQSSSVQMSTNGSGKAASGKEQAIYASWNASTATKKAQHPYPQGQNMISSFDYVYNPFPDNRANEVANSRLITRDLRNPGIYSEGLRPQDLVNLPPLHCRSSVASTVWQKRTPLGPVDMLSYLVKFITSGVRRRSRLRPRIPGSIKSRLDCKHWKHVSQAKVRKPHAQGRRPIGIRGRSSGLHGGSASRSPKSNTENQLRRFAPRARAPNSPTPAPLLPRPRRALQDITFTHIQGEEEEEQVREFLATIDVGVANDREDLVAGSQRHAADAETDELEDYHSSASLRRREQEPRDQNRGRARRVRQREIDTAQMAEDDEQLSLPANSSARQARDAPAATGSTQEGLGPEVLGSDTEIFADTPSCGLRSPLLSQHSSRVSLEPSDHPSLDESVRSHDIAEGLQPCHRCPFFPGQYHHNCGQKSAGAHNLNCHLQEGTRDFTDEYVEGVSNIHHYFRPTNEVRRLYEDGTFRLLPQPCPLKAIQGLTSEEPIFLSVEDGSVYMVLPHVGDQPESTLQVRLRIRELIPPETRRYREHVYYPPEYRWRLLRYLPTHFITADRMYDTTLFTLDDWVRILGRKDDGCFKLHDGRVGKMIPKRDRRRRNLHDCFLVSGPIKEQEQEQSSPMSPGSDQVIQPPAQIPHRRDHNYQDGQRAPDDNLDALHIRIRSGETPVDWDAPPAELQFVRPSRRSPTRLVSKSPSNGARTGRADDANAVVLPPTSSTTKNNSIRPSPGLSSSEQKTASRATKRRRRLKKPALPDSDDTTTEEKTDDDDDDDDNAPSRASPANSEATKPAARGKRKRAPSSQPKTATKVQKTAVTKENAARKRAENLRKQLNISGEDKLAGPPRYSRRHPKK